MIELVVLHILEGVCAAKSDTSEKVQQSELVLSLYVPHIMTKNVKH
jgi:hypothetical protein